MEIRTIRKDEVKKLSFLAKEIWMECYASLLSLKQIEYMTSLFLSQDALNKDLEEGYLCRVLMDDEKMVGFTLSKKEEDRSFLSKLYILNEYRGKGLGRRLVEDVYNKLQQDRIYLTVNKYNPTYQMYLHMGFEVIDSVVSDIGNGYVMDDYIMEKDFKR